MILAKLRNLVSAPSDLSSLATYIKSRFLQFEPNEASLVLFVSRCLFQTSTLISGEHKVTILYEFSGPFKSHDRRELRMGDEAIKFPIVKRDPDMEESNVLQTPAEVDLRARSDFAFAASTNWFEQ